MKAAAETEQRFAMSVHIEIGPRVQPLQVGPLDAALVLREHTLSNLIMPPADPATGYLPNTGLVMDQLAFLLFDDDNKDLREKLHARWHMRGEQQDVARNRGH
jgi:hypothetical protein